jgi:magnesium chelatase accessory protein
MGAAGPNWDRAGADWPNRSASRFVNAGGLRWHVQVSGAGPVVLLLHGTGAATHSWRGVLPLLADQFTVVAPDLPGHGFSDIPPASLLSLPGMAKATGHLLEALELAPSLCVGHSAGAAIAARMCLDGRMAPAGMVSLNGALLPLRGFAGRFFSPAAKLLANLPLVPDLVAWRGKDRAAIERLMADTGSRLDPDGIEFYRRLMASPRHVEATLGMMANWDLDAFVRDLPKLAVPLALVVGANDRTVPPRDAQRVRLLLPEAIVETQSGLGHLAHEEDPAATASAIRRYAASWGLA